MLVKCPECQRDVSDSATFCPGCGFVLKRPVAPALNAAPTPTPREVYHDSSGGKPKPKLGCLPTGLLIVGFVFLVFLAIYWLKGTDLHVTGWIFCMPLFLLMLAGYGLGGGIIVSALTTRYRDLNVLVAFGVQLLMYATPVILPMSAMPANYRWVLQYNPLTPIVEGFRLAFLGAGTVDALQLGVSFGVMLVVLAVGLMLFTHVEKTFMDTV